MIRLKKALHLFLAVSLFSTITYVHAEPDYSDSSYWNDKCSGTTFSSEDKEACTAYANYLKDQKTELGEQLKEIEAKREQYLEDIEKYAEEITAYQGQIDDKKVEIQDMQAKIDAKQAEIDAKQAEIDAKQGEIDNKQLEIDGKQAEIDATQAVIDEIQEKLLNRMAIEQGSMRVNQYTDILMGATSFDELMRIINGFNAIADYDQKTTDELVEMMDLMADQKADLEVAKGELEEAKADLENDKSLLDVQRNELDGEKAILVNEQGNLIALQYEVEVAQDAANQMAAELEAEGNKIAANIEEKNRKMQEIAAAGVLDEIYAAMTDGWTYPVPGSYRSAGTWYYPGGGVHLGYDFAAPLGSAIYAVGNGVVLNSADGCPTYGGLGSRCGYQFGGSSGGGNQVYLLTPINGSLYAVKYLHMMSGSPIASGTHVFAGDQVGQVGSSGNSSGPHCHIEIFYLGSADNFSNFAQNWNGDLAFGCGWAYTALNRLCENGVGAPCRIRPETIFGG